MTIVAISPIGKPYMYRIDTIHAVSKRSAKTVCATLNANNYLLREGEEWTAHELTAEYGAPWEMAQRQLIRRTNGKINICRRRY